MTGVQTCALPIYKEQQVKDQFKRIGHIDVEEYLPIKGCVNTYNYRNKLEFTFSNKQFLTKQQMEANLPFEKNVLGFHAPKFFDKVIDIFHCHLQSEPSNEIKNFIRDYALQNNYTFYDIKSHQGLLRNLIIRVASTNQILVNVIFAENDKEKISALLQAIQNHFPQITSLNYTINTKLNDTIYDLDVQLFYGKKYIEENLEKYTFIISPKSFFQTNPIQTVELYNVVKSFATCKGDEVLYDLYCGTGSIGIFLSDNVNKIIGVESVEDAITDARLNAKRNLLENTFFYTGDVLKICNNDFFIKHGSPDIIVIDPPRAGCHSQLLEKLLEIKCKKIIYVSCNPATQARDLQILKSSYRIVKSQAVDMFPHTHHIENVVLLQLN